MARKSEIQQLEEINYHLKIPKILIVLILFFVFIFSFLHNFPIGEKINYFLKKEVARSASCPLEITDISFEVLFIPKVLIKQIVLPGSCFESKNAVKLDQSKIYFLGPSFSPLGLAFKLETYIDGQPLNVRLASGLSDQRLQIQEDSVLLQRLKNLPLPVKLQGKASLYLNLSLNKGNLKELDLAINSKDFVLPSQTIQDIKLSSIPLRSLSIKASTPTPGKIQIDKFIMGEPQSPIRVNFKGNIKINQKAIGQSLLDLNGEVGFSEQFLESYSIVKLLLSSYSQRDGFYQIKLSGSLNSPVPGPL